MSHDSAVHETGSEDNESMLLGDDEDQSENVVNDDRSSQLTMTKTGEEVVDVEEDEGELEEGELDDDVEELPGVAATETSTVEIDVEIVTPANLSVHLSPSDPAPARMTPPTKAERKKDKTALSEPKVRGHHGRRSTARASSSYDETEKAEDGARDGSERRSQRHGSHGKHREKQRSKDDAEKKKSNYSTYVDFDDIRERFDATGDDWTNGPRSKRRRRYSRDSMRGPYDSPGSSGDENAGAEDDATTTQTQSSFYQRSYSSYEHQRAFDDLSEEEDDDCDDRESKMHGDHGDDKSQFMHAQDGGYKDSYHRSFSENKVKGHMSRKRKLVDTPMDERPPCKFFMEGKCAKGSSCPFNHDFVPPKKEEVCRFYMNDKGCTRDNCVYYHGEWPCKFFHKNGSCIHGDTCKFSHSELTDETRHLIHLEFSEDNYDNYSDNRKSNDSFQSSSTEKRKIPSLLDMQIYPPGKEPKLPPSPTFLQKGMFQRGGMRNSPMGSRSGLLGSGPPPPPRMRHRGANYNKGWGGDFTSYGNDRYGGENGSSPNDHDQEESGYTGEGGDSGDETYIDITPEDEEDEGQMNNQDFGNSFEGSSNQRDSYGNRKQQQYHPMHDNTQTGTGDDNWFPDDDDDRIPQNHGSSTSAPTVASIIKSLTQTKTQTTDAVGPIMPMFGMVPPPLQQCRPMPRGIPPLLHHYPQDMMSQGGMRPGQPSEMMSQGGGMMTQRPSCMAPSPDMMVQGMGMMVAPRGMVQPPDMMMAPHAMMALRGMAPSDIMQQRMMVPPPQNMMAPPPSEMAPRGVAPPDCMSSPFSMPPPGVGAVPPQPQMPNFDINHILSVIRGSSMLMPPVTSSEMMSANFNQSHHDPRTGTDTRFRGDDTTTTTTQEVDSFLQPPESPDQLELEIDATGKNVAYVLREITVANRPGPPPSALGKDRAAQNANDPRIRRHLQQHAPNGAAGKTRSSATDRTTNVERPSSSQESSSATLVKPKDPRLVSKRRPDDVDSGGEGDKPTEETSSSLPYTLPDIVLPPVPTPKIEDNAAASNGRATLDLGVPSRRPSAATNADAGNKTTCGGGQQPGNAKPASAPAPVPEQPLPPKLVALPEALQERNFPLDVVGRAPPKRSNSGSSSSASNDAAVKKVVVDYRNDPRYKKKKTKATNDADVVVIGADKPHPTRKSVEPGRSDSVDSRTGQNELDPIEIVTDGPEPTRNKSPRSRFPYRNDFYQPASDDPDPSDGVMETVVEAAASSAAENEINDDDDDETDPYGDENDKTSTDFSAASRAVLHSSVSFFDGVSESEESEPAQELNLKDMFKTIDPTTSPFC